MNEIIRKRKSIRKYDMARLDDETLAAVRAQLNSLSPLFPDIAYSIDIVEKTKGIFGIKAPHYLAFSSEEKDYSRENIGFVGQQMDLFFSAMGLGACWLGMAKPTDNADSALPFAISMAFGRPAETLHRNLGDFKRKPLAEISEGNDARLEAARLAPSGMNAQNWYFIAEEAFIHCYIKERGGKFGMAALANRLARIDLGIALWHIAVESRDFGYARRDDAPKREGYVYAGTVVHE